MTPDPLDQLQTALGGQYTVERELGRGGMATVYLAQDLKHKRSVALKVLHSNLAANLGPERFRREIAIAAKLHHPHILTVLDSGETPTGLLWYTMPFIEGESVRDRLRRQRQLPLEDALRITREIALALDYAHRQGVVHRDIKPENIMLVDGQAVIADFGIARVLGSGAQPIGGSLTEIGMAIGTPGYMSPEQMAGEASLDGTADVYALGAVLYEMLAGEPPFTGTTAQAIAAKAMVGDTPSVRRTRPTVPVGVDAAIRKALSPLAADRFATAALFASALDTAERFAEGPPTDVADRAVTGVAASRPRFAASAAFLGIGLLIGAAILIVWRRGERSAAAHAAAGPVGIAVLPFDAGSDTANAYFADGITYEIQGKLSALPGLRVIATASSNQYRHTTKPEGQIGRELGVHYLLTGHIQWEGAGATRRVRISPELVEVRDGVAPETRWEQSYDTTVADVFDVQAAVATQVADKLGVVLSAPDQSQLAMRPTQSLAAYDAYLRSITLARGPATDRRALASAEQAIALDSSFAAAWAVLSSLHSYLFVESVPNPADAAVAHRAAERAVALAPAAPDGYLARGRYDAYVAHDMAGARAAFETAVRLAPSSSAAVAALALADASSGHWMPALGDARKAVALDPRSVSASRDLGFILLFFRRYEDARAEVERGLTLSPSDLVLIELRAMSRLGEGDLPGARASLRDVPPTLDRAALAAFVASYYDLYWLLDSADRALVLTLPPSAFDDDRGVWALTRASLYRLAGDTVRARRYVDSSRAAYEAQLRVAPGAFEQHLYHALTLAYSGQRAAAIREGEHGLALARATGDVFIGVPEGQRIMAWVYVTTGDHQRALDQLEALLAEPHYISPAWLRIEPTWTPLRGDPRFERLIAQPPMTPIQ